MLQEFRRGLEVHSCARNSGAHLKFVNVCQHVLVMAIQATAI